MTSLVAWRRNPPLTRRRRFDSKPRAGGTELAAIGRMSQARESDDLMCALVYVSRGELLEEAPALESFAAAVPELLASARTAALGLQDILLVSRQRVHIAQRVPQSPGIALATVAPRTRSVGLIVSEARARLERR